MGRASREKRDRRLAYGTGLAGVNLVELRASGRWITLAELESRADLAIAGRHYPMSRVNGVMGVNLDDAYDEADEPIDYVCSGCGLLAFGTAVQACADCGVPVCPGCWQALTPRYA